MKNIVAGLIMLSSCCSYSQSFEVIYTKQFNSNDNLHVVNQNGKDKTITNHRRKDSSPMVSPDGKSIVFASERVGWWKIWSYDLTKNMFQQLTDAGAAEYGPSWSPNGEKIVFVSSRDGNAEVYMMDKSGANMRNLTNNKSEDTMPFWAPDGYIYYSSKVSSSYQIMRMNPDGSGKEQITTDKGDKLMPQLSNDHKSILFYGNLHGNMEVYLLELPQKKYNRLTTNPLQDIRPRWSPDGYYIVFERGNKKDNQHIYIMNADGTNVKKLTNNGYNYAPSFVPAKTSLIN